MYFCGCNFNYSQSITNFHYDVNIILINLQDFVIKNIKTFKNVEIKQTRKNKKNNEKKEKVGKIRKTKKCEKNLQRNL